MPNPSSEPVRWLPDHGRYMSPNGAGDEIIAAAVYLRNLGAIHVVLGITTVTILSAAMLLRTWAISEWPEYIPQWSGWWFWLSPIHPPAREAAGVIAVPFGWAYWFIQRDKNRQLSDWVAAPTALLVAITAFAVLKQGEPHNLYVLWSLRLLVVIPMFALLAWAAAWFRATQQVGADVEVFTRSKLSQWLAASLVAVAGLVAFAVVDSLRARALRLASVESVALVEGERADGRGGWPHHRCQQAGPVSRRQAGRTACVAAQERHRRRRCRGRDRLDPRVAFGVDLRCRVARRLSGPRSAERDGQADLALADDRRWCPDAIVRQNDSLHEQLLAPPGALRQPSDAGLSRSLQPQPLHRQQWTTAVRSDSR